ncbi:MAG TPA: hypothetical protein DCZ92_12280 [Elusimicrobia bacterium]|nr:MAG: hypothetical protein A2016_00960 [Elusimicrobia bacterium GWF2_62_30]HBA61566.1 hypothetical protein [Elusimicrobiota bacterium]
MKISLERTLLRFELEDLLLSKDGLLKFALFQFILWFSTRRTAAELYAGSPDYWASFILLQGFASACLLNSLCAMSLFVRPKLGRTIELLLSSRLRPETIACTSVTASLINNAASLLCYFLILGWTIGKTDFGWRHVLPFVSLLAANAITLVLTSFVVLQTRHGQHLASGFILFSLMLTVLAGIYKLEFSPAAGAQWLLAAVLLLALALSTAVFGLFDKEKIVSS